MAHQRRRRRRRSEAGRLRAAAWVAGVVAGLAGAAAAAHAGLGWLLTTPRLAVRTVEVEGARRLDEAAVRGAAGVEPGQNLLALDAAAAAARIRALPGVRDARVVRHLPDRVVLLVEEREPYALLNPGRSGPSGRAARLVWVDPEGHPVVPEARPGAPRLPILSGVDPAAPGRGDGATPGLRTGLALLRVVQRTGGRMAARISEIDLGRAEGPVLYTVEGTEVRVGADGWDERLARLDGVLGELEARGERMAVVDLRFRDQVVLTPRPPATGPAAGRRPGSAGPDTERR
jgi:cell division protein FtsQ